jgi:hypothetical protein
MCDPVSLGVATAALSIGGAVSKFAGERSQAKSTRGAAISNFQATFSALEARSAEVSESQSEGSFDRAIEAASKQGLIAARASDAGLSGSTVGAQIQASGFETGREQSLTARQAELQRRQIAREIENENRAKVSTLNANRGPGLLSLVLGIGQGALSGASAFTGAGGKI